MNKNGFVIFTLSLLISKSLTLNRHSECRFARDFNPKIFQTDESYLNSYLHHVSKWEANFVKEAVD